ncbi:unnamed protein product, partial [Ectocarpus sp. 6 AP-2014]
MMEDPGGAMHDNNDNATGGGATTKSPAAGGAAQPTLQQQEQRFGKRGSGQAFALGLFQILKTEDPKVIGWSASGKAFRIGDSEKFCKEIMPRFFKQNKYSSFQRQLNLYGFRKLVRGNEAGGYMHPLFERGKPEQLSQVRRGFFPEIPPEFAHDVHGHGLNDGVGGGLGDGGNVPKAGVRGGRKSTDSNRSSVGSSSKQVNASGGGGNRGHERSSSLGQSGMAPAAAAAAAAVTAAATAAAGGRGGGHIRTESGSALMGRREDCMAVEKGVWDAGGHGHGRLPSLDLVTGGLRNLHGSGGGGRNGNGGGQGVGTEMPPTLGRLVPSAENVVSRESSPMKPGAGGGGGGGGGNRMHAGSSDYQHTGNRLDGGGHHPTYGRSQDDLNLTPRSHFAGPIMGLGLHQGVAGNWAAGGVHGGGPGGGGGGGFSNSFTPNQEFFGSNGSRNSNYQGSSPRVLQNMHSRDDLDVLRPRKTRRTGPSFDQESHADNQDPSKAFLAMSPRAAGTGGDGGGGFMDERGGYLNTSAVYASPDELPPAAPRRLVSRHNTPSRPERSSASKNKGGGDGDDAGKRGGQQQHLMSLEPSSMDTDGTAGGGGGGGAALTSQGFQ